MSAEQRTSVSSRSSSLFGRLAALTTASSMLLGCSSLSSSLNSDSSGSHASPLSAPTLPSHSNMESETEREYRLKVSFLASEWSAMLGEAHVSLQENPSTILTVPRPIKEDPRALAELIDRFPASYRFLEPTERGLPIVARAALVSDGTNLVFTPSTLREDKEFMTLVASENIRVVEQARVFNLPFQQDLDQIESQVRSAFAALEIYNLARFDHTLELLRNRAAIAPEATRQEIKIALGNLSNAVLNSFDLDVAAKPRALLLYPSADEPGAFDDTQRSRNNVDRLVPGHEVLYFECDGEEDIESAFSSLITTLPPESISLCIIAAHGARESMQFGPTLTDQSHVVSSTEASILSPLQVLLKDGSEVVLFSCATGQRPDAQFPNMQQSVEKVLPRASVLALKDTGTAQFEMGVNAEFISPGFQLGSSGLVSNNPGANDPGTNDADAINQVGTFQP